VKAIGKDCDWKDFEWPLSEATKIQTWPEMIILLILAMLIWWIVLWISNRKRA
jgi:hypothetical protein